MARENSFDLEKKKKKKEQMENSVNIPNKVQTNND